MRWLYFQKPRTYEVSISDRCTHCGYCLKLCPMILRWAAESEKGRLLSVRSKAIREALFRCEAGCPVGAIQVRELREDAEKGFQPKHSLQKEQKKAGG